MKLELITLDGPKANGDVYEVLIPTPDGTIAVFPGHERLVTLAKSGVISIRNKKTDLNEAMEHFATYGGIVEVSPTHLRILVDEADTANEIIEEESLKALALAEDMKKKATDAVELEKAQALIDRHAVRLHVANLRRRHH